MNSPRQAPCGDRFCGACFTELQQRLVVRHTYVTSVVTSVAIISCRDKEGVTCPQCHQQIILATVK